MYPTVKNVVPQDDYMLALEFDNVSCNTKQ